MDLSAKGIIRYFDLRSGRPGNHSAGRLGIVAFDQVGGGAARVVPQYIALVLGIVAEPYLHYYAENGNWSVTFSAVIGRIVFGVIVGAVVFPAVYKNSFDPNQPAFIQFCAIFAAGIGWQSLIQGGAKAILPTG